MANEHLQQYVDYIRNTGHDPLPIAYFDEDWEPIGPMVRRDLIKAGLTEEVEGGIRLTPRALRRADGGEDGSNRPTGPIAQSTDRPGIR